MVIAIFLFITTVSAQEDVSCYHCHTKVVGEFRNNIHYQKGFTCEDCHGGSAQPNATVISYTVMSGDFTGRPSRANITNVCSKCHSQEAKDYKMSIH
ncbi:MAG: multiheme c-type cytochrome, partial [Candidatus Methanoperedens sp.]